MEAHYRPAWKPSIIDRQWKPPSDDDIWAFSNSSLIDDDALAKGFVEFMSDEKNVASNIRQKNNLSTLGLVGIDNLMVKLGGVLQVEFLMHISKAFT
jgi:hypothetical protein